MRFSSCNLCGCWFGLALFSLFFASLAGMADPEVPAPVVPQYERLLTSEDEVRAGELEERISQLRREGKYDTALRPAAEVLDLRQRVQGADHWETISARQLLASLELIAGLTAEQQAEAARAYTSMLEVDRLAGDGDYAEAAELAGSALEIRRRLLGDGDFLTLNAMHDLGYCLYKVKQYEDAEARLRETLAARRRLLGPEHPSTLTTGANLGHILTSQNGFEEAEQFYADALAGRRRVLGEDSPLSVHCIYFQADLCADQGRWEDAEAGFREALAGYRRVQGEDHEDTIMALETLAQILELRNKLDEAEEYLLEAVETARRALGPDHPETLDLLNRWGWFLKDMGRYAESEAVLRDVLERRRSLYGDDDPSVSASLHSLGSLLYVQGRLDEAEVEFSQALELRLRLYGEDSKHTLGTMINRAHVLVGLGRLSEAEQSYRKGLEGRRALYGDDHPRTIFAMSSMGYCLRNLGRLSEAEEYFRLALDGFRSYYPDDHPQTLTAMINVGHVLEAQWRLPEAEPLLRRALTGFRETRGDDHPDTLLALHNMANLLESQGHLDEAETAYRETLEGRQRVLGPDHPRTITVKNNLGRLAKHRGKMEEAESLLGQALADRRRVLGDENPHTLTTIGNVGSLMVTLGRLDEAEPLLREALETRRKVLGGHHPATLGSMLSLGRLLELQGQTDEAEKMIREAIDGLRQVFGDAHPDVTGGLNLLAGLRYREGDLAGATAAWTEAAVSFEAARLRSGARGLERVYFATGHSPLGALAACLARSGKALPAWERFEASLSRGLLDTISSRHARPLTPEKRRQESDLISRLSRLDERLGRLYSSLAAATGPEPAAAAEELRAERDQLLEELARFQSEVSEEYGVLAGEVYGLQRIQSRIPSGTALLGWIDLEMDRGKAGFTGEHWACLVRRTGPPVWVSMPGSGTGGSWTDGDTALAEQLRETLGKRTRRSADRRRLALIRQRLKAQRIDPLEGHLEGIHNLVVLPAGWMAGIPVEVLTEEYTVSYAPSGTMFAWLSEKRGPQAGSSSAAASPLLALGDPLFNRTELSAAPQPEDPARGGAEKGQSSETPLRSAPAPSPERLARIESLTPLPGTRREVKAIARLFDPPEGKPGPLVLLGSEASEQRLDALSVSGQLGDFRYIHLATHGVMDDQVAMRSALILSQDQLGDSFQRVIEGKNVFDGWLTGEQIVRSWKLDAELVTLSGCETALGQEAGGEGYLGFSQALFVAGARSLVLSLWKVDDRATMLLMQRFYENLLGRFSATRTLPGAEFKTGVPMPRAEALREAKVWLRGLTAEEVRELDPAGTRSATRDPDSDRSDPVEKLSGRPYEDPRYWAAFILLGDPR